MPEPSAAARAARTTARTAAVIGVLGVLHYLWLVKADHTEPLLYGGVLAVLLGYRLWWWRTHSATVSRSTR